MHGTRNQIEYEKFDSPEHQSWKNHRELTLKVSGDAAGYRGCIGLSLVIDATTINSWIDNLDRRFAPDSTIKWVSLVDIPSGNFRQAALGRREIHWGTVRPTTTKFGVPMLARKTEERAWDFRGFPHDTLPGVQTSVSGDTLSPSKYPQMFRVLNALDWAMTSTAFHFRHDWKPKRKAFYDQLEIPFQEETKTLLFGEATYDGVARPLDWMPRAYLAFPESVRPNLFTRATQPAMGQNLPPFYTDGMKVAFVEAMGDYLGYRVNFGGKVHSITPTKTHGIPTLTVQLRGDRGESATVVFHRDAVVRKASGTKFKRMDTIAEERFVKPVPEDWYDRNWFTRWDKWVSKMIPGRLDAYLRLWFDRQALSLLPGMIHLPAQISSIAALGSAIDSALMWELDSALEYYRTDCDACIFPTIQISRWDQLSGVLPGDVHYDFTPSDRRFLTVEARRQRVEEYRQGNATAAAVADLLKTPQKYAEERRQKDEKVVPTTEEDRELAMEMAEALNNEKARAQGKIGPVTQRRMQRERVEATIPDTIEVTPASEEDRELAIELAAALATEAAKKKAAELKRKQEYDERKKTGGKKHRAPGLVSNPV